MMHDSLVYPFVAIVGQEKMKLALILNVINPTLGGLLIRGAKGTAKSTAVRALADILPKIEAFENDPFNLCPHTERKAHRDCAQAIHDEWIECKDFPPIIKIKVRVVELPIGASKDQLVGTLDLDHAHGATTKRVKPGFLAAAHRHILYVEEVSLLEDHVIDVLLNSAAGGINTIEREGRSFSHPARFTLVATINPDEGLLRPQLLDRFGLYVDTEEVQDPDQRVEIMKRKVCFELNRDDFCLRWDEESLALTRRIQQAVDLYPKVTVKPEQLHQISSYCLSASVDGQRREIITLNAAKTLAAYYGRREVIGEDIDTVVEFTLPHWMRWPLAQEAGPNVEVLLAHS